MALTPEEDKQVAAYLTPMSEFEYLFSDKTPTPRANSLVAHEQDAMPLGHYIAAANAPVPSRPARETVSRSKALQDGYITLDSAPTADLLTVERALLHYGHDVAEERNLPVELLDSAEMEIEELLDSARPAKTVAPHTLSLAVLALAHMEEAEDDPVQRVAASRAFEIIPKAPEEIAILRRQAMIGRDTGELVVRAILEHEPISA